MVTNAPTQSCSLGDVQQLDARLETHLAQSHSLPKVPLTTGDMTWGEVSNLPQLLPCLVLGGGGGTKKHGFVHMDSSTTGYCFNDLDFNS
jgi:hypothetical protein